MKNYINKIGISVYTLEEAIESLKNPHIQYLQIPVNFLDQRWYNLEFQTLIKKREDVFIYIRSIFLQGILIHDNDKWPKLVNINTNEYVKKIDNIVKIFNLENKVNLCISYTKSLSWIDGVVFGIDNSTQLIQNIKLFKEYRELTKNELEYIAETFNDIPHQLLNPKYW